MSEKKSSSAEEANRLHWDEVAPVHREHYGIDRFLAGESRIDEIQKKEFYPVKGKDLIHLQCHIGTDTLSLARDGARVTGVDFSGASLDVARELAERLQIDAKFIEANVLEINDRIKKKFDIVYTSKGVLCWISDIDRWADTIARLLKDGGVFYIMETHPFLPLFDDTRADDLHIVYPYFHRFEPVHFNDDHPDYADNSYIPFHKTYEWFWSLSDIFNALIRHGLSIELFNEHDRWFSGGWCGMEMDPVGWWYIKKYKGMLPFTFSLRARKKG